MSRILYVHRTSFLYIVLGIVAVEVGIFDMETIVSVVMHVMA